MSRLAVFGLGLLLPVLLVACDSGGDNDVDTLSGSWRGTVERQGTEYIVVLNLQQLQGGQSANVVRGDGTVQSADASFAFTITSGTFAPASNEILLPQQYESGRTGQVRGTVGDDRETMTVMLFGGPVSFNGDEVTLNRDG
jgi:hypothetical protein